MALAPNCTRRPSSFVMSTARPPVAVIPHTSLPPDDPVVDGADASDLSTLQWLQQTLSRSERRFRTLTQLAPVGIFLTDADQQCYFVNDRALELTGLPPE